MSTEVVLYHNPQSRSRTVHWLLEEIGCTYELRFIDFKAGDQRAPEFLAKNPMGKIPVIEHKGRVISEAAAICLYLADCYVDAGLSVGIESEFRGELLQWLFYSPSCLEVALLDVMLERPITHPGALPYGDMSRCLSPLEKVLKGNDYLVGNRFTAADVVVGSCLHWGYSINALPDNEVLGDYLDLLRSRKAFQTVDNS